MVSGRQIGYACAVASAATMTVRYMLQMRIGNLLAAASAFQPQRKLNVGFPRDEWYEDMCGVVIEVES